MHKPFVGALPVLDILPLEVRAALAAVAEPGEEDVDPVLRRPVAEHQVVALGAAERVDEARGFGPQGVVEHAGVQRCQDASKQVVPAHGRPLRQRAFPRRPRKPPAAPVLFPASACIQPPPLPVPARAGPCAPRMRDRPAPMLYRRKRLCTHAN